MSDRRSDESTADPAPDLDSDPDLDPAANSDSDSDCNPNSESVDTESADIKFSAVSIEDDGLVRWFFRSDDETVVAVRDVVTTIAVVAAIGLLLFAVSGIWPPMVAVESGSMEPNMATGDFVFIVDDDRFVGDDPADETGIVPLENGQDGVHERFGEAGDVVIFQPNGDPTETPVIHRAHFWVDEGENWVETKADADALDGRTCATLTSCPAPHDGFVTKGDANGVYDQVESGGADTTVVEPEWVTSKSVVRIPWLGYVRVTLDSLFAVVSPQPVSGPLVSPISAAL